MMLQPVTPRNGGLGLTWSQIWSGGYCPGCPGYSVWPMGPCSCEDLKIGPGIPGVPGRVTSPPWLTPPAPQTERQLTQPGAWTPDVLWGIQTQRAKDQIAGVGVSGSPVPPPGDKENWFDEYKWWLLGGAATIGIVAGIGGSRGAQAASRGARKAKITRIGSVIPVLLVAGAGLFLVGNITGGVGTAKFLSS